MLSDIQALMLISKMTTIKSRKSFESKSNNLSGSDIKISVSKAKAAEIIKVCFDAKLNFLRLIDTDTRPEIASHAKINQAVQSTSTR